MHYTSRILLRVHFCHTFPVQAVLKPFQGLCLLTAEQVTISPAPFPPLPESSQSPLVASCRVSFNSPLSLLLEWVSGVTSQGRKRNMDASNQILVGPNSSAVVWRKVLLVLKVILRYGHLKFFCSLDQIKAPRKAWRWPHLKI